MKKWQQYWFYCSDVPTYANTEGLPLYSAAPLIRRRSCVKGPSAVELDDMEILHQEVQRLIDAELSGLDILVTWMDRRLRPL